VAAVVVAAHEAWIAEAVAKAMIVAGLHDAPVVAARAGVVAWCFHDDGTTVTTGRHLTSALAIAG
jgi:hypothetical protein